MTITKDRSNLSAYQDARKAMVDGQLRTSGVNAADVLERMTQVPREDFVPAAARGTAYMDRAIALDGGGHLASPLMQGMMLQETAPTLADHAVVVDGGSNYLAELVRPMVGSLAVITPQQAASGEGIPSETTLLLIDGAAEILPAALETALPENCRIGTGLIAKGITQLAVGRKVGGSLSFIPLAEMGIPVLSAFAKPRAWAF